ncbi:hypothetical protein E1B28_012792 [Marasmius oreades]|uniref:NAD-dependent epimerase/dehydratase domain-containing protein n=1 Tax=Marasmius oreades TaxID=181124 RepID=A0A9P7RSU5_9AGAR|nr:uncharacterized protein E1B28_012792 [Marasmius oreades]KAG7088837.1 hypothetical protein E1B28_012792 [Marasmius oreades]
MLTPFALQFGRPPCTMSASKTALIIGATGQTGGYLLKELLASPHFKRVHEYGRGVTQLETLSEGKEKLEQKIIDFEKLEEDGALKGGKWDVVFITLGTTRAKAGSAEAFEKIDREYVIRAAREAKSNDPSHPQRLVYCSTNGANSQSSFLYPRSKGLTEEGLAALGYSDTIIFRPGFLVGTARPELRIGEYLATKVTGVLSYFSSKVEIKVATLGKAMSVAGYLGTESLPPQAGATKSGKEGAQFTLIGNVGALELAKNV